MNVGCCRLGRDRGRRLRRSPELSLIVQRLLSGVSQRLLLVVEAHIDGQRRLAVLGEWGGVQLGASASIVGRSHLLLNVSARVHGVFDVMEDAGWCRVEMDWGNPDWDFGTYHLQSGHFEKGKEDAWEENSVKTTSDLVGLRDGQLFVWVPFEQ